MTKSIGHRLPPVAWPSWTCSMEKAGRSKCAPCAPAARMPTSSSATPAYRICTLMKSRGWRISHTGTHEAMKTYTVRMTIQYSGRSETGR